MTLSDLIQTAIVAAHVGFAVWQLSRRFLPKKATTPSAGCGSGGCDTCGACKTISFDINSRD